MIELLQSFIEIAQLSIGPIVMVLGLYTVYTCITLRAGLAMWLIALFIVALATVPTLFTLTYYFL